MDIVTLFCEIDDFCVRMTPWLNAHLLPARQHQRESRLHLSEVITILVGKSSVGWFFGFKLHLVVNEAGELLACCLTSGNVAGALWAPTPVPQLVKDLFGKLFGDKGYLSQPLHDQLLAQDLQLITKFRRKMQNKLMPLLDKILLRKRAIIETIVDQLKNIPQIEHTRHRSSFNMLSNLIAGLIAYSWRPTKPSLGIRPHDMLVPIVL